MCECRTPRTDKPCGAIEHYFRESGSCTVCGHTRACHDTKPVDTADPRVYPCDHCGRMRNKAEGGTIFTLCDECWDKHFKKDSAPADPFSGHPRCETCGNYLVDYLWCKSWIAIRGRADYCSRHTALVRP